MYQYYPHDLAFIDIQFRDGTWNLYDPDQDASFWVHVYDSEDMVKWIFSLSTPVPIIRISTGKFKVEGIILDQGPSPFAFGVAYYRWYAEKDGVPIEMYPVFEFCFQVLESISGNMLCSLAAVKTYLNLTSSNHDPFLNAAIVTATRFLERYCRRIFKVTDYDEYYDGDGTNRLVLNQMPVQSITLIEDAYGGSGTSYDDTDEHGRWECYWDEGILELISDVFPSRPPKTNRVTYSAGYQTIPEDVAQVAKELVALEFKRSNRTGASRLGVMATTMAGQNVQYRSEDLSPLHKKILAPYRSLRHLGAV